MDRRGFLLGAGVLLVAGCARVRPTSPADSASPAAAPLAIGSDNTATGQLLAALFAQAVTATGRPATVTASGEDWLAALSDASLAALPAFATTIWDQLSEADEPPTPEEVLTDVADLVAPEISLLPAGDIDGGLVWMIGQAGASAGVNSLDELDGWSAGKTAAIPALAEIRGDGVPGLVAVYRAAFTTEVVADPVERARQVVDGHADLAAFRRTEYTGATGLVPLADPDRLLVADPLVVLVNTALTDAEPEAALALAAVADALTAEALAELQAKIAAGSPVATVAGDWLAANI